MITDKVLAKIMPHLPQSKRAEYLPHLNAAMAEFGITNQLRAAAFLAQLAHESAELRYMQEIADGSAYEGRRDLGNIKPGDGKRYKGRGPIQLTGRANYHKTGAALGLPLETQPEIATRPEIAFRIAGYYWRSHGLNELADLRQFKAITKRINGGLNGLSDRVSYYERALLAVPVDFHMSDAPAAPAVDEVASDLFDEDEEAEVPSAGTQTVASVANASEKIVTPPTVVVEKEKPADAPPPDKIPGINASKIGAGLSVGGVLSAVGSILSGARKEIVIGLVALLLVGVMVWLVMRFWYANKAEARKVEEREAEARRAHEITMAKIASAKDGDLTVKVTQ